MITLNIDMGYLAEKDTNADYCNLFGELKRDKLAMEAHISSFIASELNAFTTKYGISLKDVTLNTGIDFRNVHDTYDMNQHCSTMKIETDIKIKL